MRKGVDEAKEQIELWLRSGVPQREVARRLSCKIETLKARLRMWGLQDLKNQSGKGTAKYGNRSNVWQYLDVAAPLTNSHRLKRMLWREGLKPQHCEQCGWAEVSVDGRLPLELDHIDNDHYDNRLENLQILCPNCHALKPGNSGGNIGRYTPP